MNNEGNKFLPLGTIVMLKGASKRLMITGFCIVSPEEENGKMHDYSGCLYPEGIINSKQTAVFDHEQIDKIYYMGYSDDEEKSFKTKLNELLAQNNNSVIPTPQNNQEVVDNVVERPQPVSSNEFTIPALDPMAAPQQAPATFNTLNLNDFNN